MSQYPIDQLHTRHNRRAFASGSDPLDNYFRQLAKQDIRRDLAAVYVMHDPSVDLVVGYYTLCATGLAVEQLPPDIAQKLPHYPTFPAVLLGRLAVDMRYRGRGFGGELLIDAIRRILRLGTDIGIAFVVVDAIDDAARRFYERFEFRPVLETASNVCSCLQRLQRNWSARSHRASPIARFEGDRQTVINVLYIGDSETVISRYAVGADVFEQAYFNDNGRYLRNALADHPDITIRHIIPASVPSEFPTTDEELAAYDVVIFSDVGYNSIVFRSTIERTRDPATVVV